MTAVMNSGEIDLFLKKLLCVFYLIEGQSVFLLDTIGVI